MAGVGPTGLGGMRLGRSASARLALALLLALALVRGLEEARAEDGAERGADPVDGDGRGLAGDDGEHADGGVERAARDAADRRRRHDDGEADGDADKTTGGAVRVVLSAVAHGRERISTDASRTRY